MGTTLGAMVAGVAFVATWIEMWRPEGRAGRFLAALFVAFIWGLPVWVLVALIDWALARRAGAT